MRRLIGEFGTLLVAAALLLAFSTRETLQRPIGRRAAL